MPQNLKAIPRSVSRVLLLGFIFNGNNRYGFFGGISKTLFESKCSHDSFIVYILHE